MMRNKTFVPELLLPGTKCLGNFNYFKVVVISLIEYCTKYGTSCQKYP